MKSRFLEQQPQKFRELSGVVFSVARDDTANGQLATATHAQNYGMLNQEGLWVSATICNFWLIPKSVSSLLMENTHTDDCPLYVTTQHNEVNKILCKTYD